MVKHSMDLLELLRKRGMDGDVDFLREALRVLVDGIMDAEVSALVLQRNRVQLRLLAHPLIQSSGEFRRFCHVIGPTSYRWVQSHGIEQVRRSR